MIVIFVDWASSRDKLLIKLEIPKLFLITAHYALKK